MWNRKWKFTLFLGDVQIRFNWGFYFNLNTMMTSWIGNIFRVTGPLWGIHRSPVNSPHKGQWCEASMFSLICPWINDWVNNREACDLRLQRAFYNVIVMPLHDLGSTKYIYTTKTVQHINHYTERYLPFSVGERENVKCHGHHRTVEWLSTLV